MGDLIGAIRLPNNAFKKNAGTEVTTDIIILRKKESGVESSGENWLEAVDSGMVGRNERPMLNNEYFIKHPEMIWEHW